jgi:AcrR family transcriptional regulator
MPPRGALQRTVNPDPASSPASPFNRKAQHDAKRAAILSEAAKLFNGKGSRATTLQDVARGLGLTKTSLYYYVKTKEELIFLCYEAALQHKHQRMDRIEATHASPLARAAAFFREPFETWLGARDGRTAHIAALLEIASLKPSHRGHLEAEYVRMFKRLRGYLRDAIDAGEVRPCETTSTTRAIIGATDWAFYWLHQLPDDRVAGAADLAWEIILHGLAAGPGEYRPVPLAVSGASEQRRGGFDREEQNRQKQEAFYQAGTWFFNKKGFTGASLDEIAEHLNVSKGAFYYHIRNKEDLLYACYERSIGITGASMPRPCRGTGSGVEKSMKRRGGSFTYRTLPKGPLIRYNTITALPTPRRKEILAATEHLNRGSKASSSRAKATAACATSTRSLARNLMTGAINASMDISLWRSRRRY